jgi:excisionase family DNA binding protein
MPETQPRALWSVSDLARRLRVSRMSIIRHIEAGELEAYPVGVDGEWRIPPRAVDELLRPAKKPPA